MLFLIHSYAEFCEIASTLAQPQSYIALTLNTLNTENSMNSSITQKLPMRARVFSKSTCRHNIGGVVGDLQALCSAVMHYQRQGGRRVRIQGHKGVWGSKCLAAHTLLEAGEPPAPCSTRADPAGLMAPQPLLQDFTWIYTQRRAPEHGEVVCRYLYC